MNRCFVDQHVWQESEIELSGEESHHLLHALRSKPGEIIEIFDGRGHVAGAKLISGRDNIARLAILPESIRMVAPDPVSITLIQAVPKHTGMEEIIQKATELGVQKIIPAITARVVIKLKERSGVSRVERWQKIALASAKQSRAAWLTEISAILPLQEAAGATRADLRLFGSLAPETLSLKKVLGPISRPAVKSIALFIGPEGDFTEAERELLLAAGFKPAGFGSRVLRVGTAAVFGLSVLNYEFRT